MPEESSREAVSLWNGCGSLRRSQGYGLALLQMLGFVLCNQHMACQSLLCCVHSGLCQHLCGCKVIRCERARYIGSPVPWHSAFNIGNCTATNMAQHILHLALITLHFGTWHWALGTVL